MRSTYLLASVAVLGFFSFQRAPDEEGAIRESFARYSEAQVKLRTLVSDSSLLLGRTDSSWNGTQDSFWTDASDVRTDPDDIRVLTQNGNFAVVLAHRHHTKTHGTKAPFVAVLERRRSGSWTVSGESIACDEITEALGDEPVTDAEESMPLDTYVCKIREELNRSARLQAEAGLPVKLTVQGVLVTRPESPGTALDWRIEVPEFRVVARQGRVLLIAAKAIAGWFLPGDAEPKLTLASTRDLFVFKQTFRQGLVLARVRY